MPFGECSTGNFHWAIKLTFCVIGVMMGPLPDGVNQLNILMNGSGKPTALAGLMGY